MAKKNNRPLRLLTMKENVTLIQKSSTSICVLVVLLIIGCGRQANSDAEVDAALRLFDQRDFAAAIPLLEEALDKNAGAYSKSQVFTTIGNCYNELGEYDKSLEYHDRAIEADPANHQAYVNKGIVHRLLGNYDEAAQLYKQALDLAPNYPELHASMGALAVYQDDFETAVKHLERAVELDDSLAVAHSNLAIAYATIGRFEEAEDQLKKAIVRGYHQPEIIRERIEQLRKVSEDE